jgi:hypothetical protein
MSANRLGACDLGHLERDIARVANDLGADLDHLLRLYFSMWRAAELVHPGPDL